MRVLALDWGTVRIGGAVSDPDGKIAFPLDNFFSNENAVSEIKALVDEKGVERIIIGLPKNMAGTNSKSTEAVEAFAARLQEQVACSIEFVDERLSSVGASKILSEEGVSQRDQRGLVDNLAAQQMLQQYLETKNKK